MDTPEILAQRLEGILRKHLDCHYLDFGIKNDNLLRYDWKSPVNFALGHRYAISNHDSKVKEDIDYFLGNIFIGEHIEDVINRHDHYGLESQENALNRVEEIITEIKRLLSK